MEVPVFELAKWNEASVKDALHSALNHLTGDRWTVHFVQRSGNGAPGGQQPLELEYQAKAVIPFSDGLDSCSVAEIEGRTLGNALVRIRLGAARDLRRKGHRQKPFANVPYTVKGEHKEPSMRSRGFKFGVVSGLAAYLANSSRVIMPESGQGVIGPAIVPLGQAYPDFRSHPTFLRKHEKFLEALLGQKVMFEFGGFVASRLWLFKNSQHILDQEPHVEKYLASAGFRDGDRPLANWRFADSKHEGGIQVSDLVTGLLGKLFTYFNNTEVEQIRIDATAFSDIQRTAFRSLNALIDNSIDECPGFANYVNSMEDRRRAHFMFEELSI